MTLLQRSIDESVAVIRALSTLEAPVQRAADLVLRYLTSGHKLVTSANGGSAAEAAHLSTEFLCRFRDDRRPYPAIALTVDGPFLTTAGNDYAFVEIIDRQVRGLGQKGDVLIAFTTSGKSRNVLRALEEAKRAGLESICFLGRDGLFTEGIAAVDVMASGASTARIQEAHKLLLHVLCDMADDKLPKD